VSYPYLIVPRPYQKKAMKRIYQRMRFGCFFKMGTGKTKTALDFVANMVWHGKLKRTLIVCKQEVFPVWEDEIEKNCPWLTYSFFTKEDNPDWKANVVFINYEYVAPRATKKVITRGKRKGKKVRRLNKERLEMIMEWGPECVIVDEGHRIKNPYSRRSKALHKLGKVCRYAIDLTGTPIGNKPLDLWSQFRFLVPELLNETYNEFKEEYARWGGFGGFKLIEYRNLDKLARLIRPYVLRVEKPPLPPKNWIERRVSLPAEARRIYKEMEEDFITTIEDKEVSVPIALAKLTKLCQIAGGFIRDNNGEDIHLHSEKLNMLLDITEELQEQGTKRVVIFARFRWEMKMIGDALKEQGWPVFYMTSDKKEKNKAEARKGKIKEWNGPDGGAFICQIASGSEGNNLQAANYMIFYSWDFSLINWEQAQDRIHRIGQTLPCYYYVLIAKGTQDARIYRLLAEHQAVAENFHRMVREAA
jgi:SNF2 family DNA or RNA helicase